MPCQGREVLVCIVVSELDAPSSPKALPLASGALGGGDMPAPDCGDMTCSFSVAAARVLLSAAA